MSGLTMNSFWIQDSKVEKGVGLQVLGSGFFPDLILRPRLSVGDIHCELVVCSINVRRIDQCERIWMRGRGLLFQMRRIFC